MEIAYFNGKFLPKDKIKISPDDRGFLFADGIYEVVRWYQGHFYDIDSHLLRLKRSLKELRIIWAEEDSFPYLARELITLNELEQQPSLVYIQITRGVAPRTHDFPSPAVSPTVYAFARNFMPDSSGIENGVDVLLKKEMRWSRCDIKSVSLLPNTLSFQEAKEQGYQECIFIRDGLITRGHTPISSLLLTAVCLHILNLSIFSPVSQGKIYYVLPERKESLFPSLLFLIL